MISSPLHLYVHIPFCIHKCHYCDFNSHERDNPDWDAYQHSLCSELQAWAKSETFKHRTIHTIFFGGGTPSLAPPSLINTVIQTTRSLFSVARDVEITLEANPGTIDSTHFSGYKKAGVNRLSIGVQSLNTSELQWLERIHDARQAISAFETACRTGFDNINLDVMYGLPGQSLDAWLETLHRIIQLRPQHLSCYQLTVEAHTRLATRHAQKPYPLPDDELALTMLQCTRTQLQNAGYQAYEISNYSLPGKYCRHNDAYWLYHDYIGIGAGASGKWDTPDGGIVRYSNIRTPETYITTSNRQGTAINSQESLNRNKSAAEAVWLGLRRSNGIDRNSFRKRFDMDAWECFATQLEPWQTSGDLQQTEQLIRLTAKGLPLADAIAASVL